LKEYGAPPVFEGIKKKWKNNNTVLAIGISPVGD